jgi:ABC-2 type transport system permease protein
MAPSLFLFLVPAITMRLLAEERQLGTLALLLTKPIDEMGLVIGKFLAAVSLLFLALVPTLFYYITLYFLGSPVGNLDTGAILGSYLGLLLLGSAFAAIGMLASSLTESQIVAFVLAVTGCFLFFYGFYFLSGLPVFFWKMGRVSTTIWHGLPLPCPKQRCARYPRPHLFSVCDCRIFVNHPICFAIPHSFLSQLHHAL